MGYRNIYDTKEFRILISPWVLMLLLNFLGSWGMANGGNPYMIGLLLMWLSCIIVYFTFIWPDVRKLEAQIKRRRKK